MSILRRYFVLSVLLVMAGCPAAFGQTKAYPLLQQQTLKQTGTGATGTAKQGAALAISADGNTAIVGGPADNSNIGGAWIFVRSGNTWTQQGGELIGTGATGAAQQGTSVAISGDGNTVMIGGPSDNSGAGAAWVFTRAEGEWTQQGNKLVGTAASVPASQGRAVALSGDGNTAAIGGNTDRNNAGSVWIFTRSAGAWTQDGGKIFGSAASGPAGQGASLAMSSDGLTIVFGGPNDGDGGPGAAWIFNLSEGDWIQRGNKLVGSGATGNALEGTSVALSGDAQVAVLGGPGDNSGAGAFWIFRPSGGGSYTQQANKLVATGPSATAAQGSSVASNGDGSVILIGAPNDASSDGTVVIFARTALSTWSQQGGDLFPSDGSESGKVGSGVALSADGSEGFIGASALGAGAAWPYFTNTFFGTVNVNSSVTQTISIAVQSNFTTGSLRVVTQGATGLDFTAASTQPESGACAVSVSFTANSRTCSINVQFTPAAPGVRFGAVQLYDNDGNNLKATVYLYGVGAAPQIGFVSGLIATVAGNGTAGYSGDSGPAPAAEMNFTNGTAFDPAGNLYIADFNNNVIRGVAENTGDIATVVGIAGEGGYSGNGGAPTAAELDGPETPIIDGAGNLYWVESNNYVVRKVDSSTDIISTFGGSGTSGYSGDGGLATAATMNNPFAAIVANNGDIYVADFGNFVVRRISAATGIISTVAGTGVTGYSGDGGPATQAAMSPPAAVMMDAAGNLYISDDNNFVIRKITFGTGTISTVIGNGEGDFSGDNGPALSAGINDVEGLAIDPAGDIYLTDSGNNAVRVVNAVTQIINSIGGVGGSDEGYTGDMGPATAALLAYPNYPSLDAAGDVFFSDGDNNVVRVIGSVAPLSFATTNVGDSAAAQDVTVTNNGNATLIFTSISASANFNLDGADTTCTSSTQLAPSESCVLGVVFAPLSGGEINGSVTLTDNSAGSPQTITLFGVGAQVTPAITLSVQPSSASLNQSVTFTAVLVPIPGAPRGTVEFCDITNQDVASRPPHSARAAGGREKFVPADGIFGNCDGGTLLGSGNVDETGTATFSTTGLSAETHTIVAIYSGNAGFNEALSNSVPITISSLTGTTTTLAANPNPAGTGQTVTFTALVSPVPTGSPLGSVSFCLGSLDVGTRMAALPATAASRTGRRPVFTPDGQSNPCGPATLLSTMNLGNSGSATFATASLALGTNIVTAIYSGNTNFGTSISNSISEVINSAVTTTTTLSANPNPAGIGQSVTFTALVSPAPSGSPLGSVSFCLGSLDGSTRLAASAFAPGARAATRPGFSRDENENPCGSATLLGTVNLNGSGSAMFATSSLSLGTNIITAIYSGNAGSAASISNSISEVINSAIGTITTLTVSPNPANAGQAVTLTATIAPVPTGSPFGSVTFCLGGSNDAVRMAAARTRPSGAARAGRGASAAPEEQSTCGSGTSLNTADVDSTGTATFTSSSLASGSLILTAVYSGNATSDSSTSDPVSEVINPAFTVTAPQTPFDVPEDGSVAITVTVPPLGGSFTNVVTLSATGLPPGATATFNPPMVTPGSAGAQTVMTVVLAGGKSSASHIPSAPPAGPAGRVAGVLAGLCLLAGILSAGFRGTARRRLAAQVILFAAVSGSIVLLSACSGGFAGGAVTPKGAYVITVTGTSGSLQASTTVNLVVE